MLSFFKKKNSEINSTHNTEATEPTDAKVVITKDTMRFHYQINVDCTDYFTGTKSKLEVGIHFEWKLARTNIIEYKEEYDKVKRVMNSFLPLLSNLEVSNELVDVSTETTNKIGNNTYVLIDTSAPDIVSTKQLKAVGLFVHDVDSELFSSTEIVDFAVLDLMTYAMAHLRPELSDVDDNYIYNKLKLDTTIIEKLEYGIVGF